MDWRDIAGALHGTIPFKGPRTECGIQWARDCDAIVHVFLGEGDFDMDAFYAICETGAELPDARK